MEAFLTVFAILLFALVAFNFWRLHGRKEAYDRDTQIAKLGCISLLVIAFILILLFIWL